MHPNAEAPRTSQALVIAAFLTVVVFLGVNFVAVRISNRELAPFWGAALRFFVAGLVLFAIVKGRRLPLPRGRGLAAAAWFGVLSFGASYALLYYALLAAPSGVAAVVFATMPLLALGMAAGFGLERLNWRSVVGGLVALSGIAYVFREQLTTEVPLGSLLAVLAAAALGALATVLLKRGPRTHPLAANAVAMPVGAVVLLALALVAREPIALPELRATWAVLGWLVASSIVGFGLLFWILARWPASAVSYSTVLMPLVTVAVATRLAGEALTPALAIGGVITLAGVWLGALSKPGTPATRQPRAERGRA